MRKLQFDNSNYLLIPTNRNYEIIAVNEDDVEIIGKVVELRVKNLNL